MDTETPTNPELAFNAQYHGEPGEGPSQPPPQGLNTLLPYHLLSARMSKLQDDVFSSDALTKLTQTVLEPLTEHLANDSVRGLQLRDPRTLRAELETLLHSNPAEDDPLTTLRAIVDLYLSTGIQVHSRGYMGRQFSGVLPLSAVVDFVSSIINQPSSFYEAAQLPKVIEQIMAEEINQFIGWAEDQFAMLTVSGGSLGNLTALLAARNAAFPDYWTQGADAVGDQRPAIMMGADTHYSASRAAGILGIGEQQIIRLPLNDRYQIDCTQLESVLLVAQAAGQRVFCLVAAAGTTSTGAFDDLNALADFCQYHDIWLHVDGAHGGSLLVSDTQREKLAGIERVDSFVLDAHKTLFVPAMCTLLFFRNKQHSRGSFRQQASYVFEQEADIYTAMDTAEQNFECTKRPMIMNLWVPWVLYGRQTFADKLDYLSALTGVCHAEIESLDDFTSVHAPEFNIFCFRYEPPGWQDCDFDLQLQIRNQTKAAGNFFISKVDIDGETALRVVFMNHKIRLADFRALLAEIRQCGQRLLAQGHLPGIAAPGP